MVCASVYFSRPSVAVAAADAGLLHAAHGRVVGGVGRAVPLVDVDGAGLDPGGERAAARQVAGPDGGVEAVVGVVGQLDRLVVRRRTGRARRPGRRSRRGTVSMLLGDAREDGGLVEQRAEVGAGLAAGRAPSAPLATASSTCALTASSWRREISEPIRPDPVVAPRRASARSPGGRTAPRRRRTRRRGRTAARCDRQSCPALVKQARIAPWTATSRSASSSTIIGFLPPSSSEQPISRLAGRFGDLPAAAGGAGEHHVVGVRRSARHRSRRARRGRPARSRAACPSSSQQVDRPQRGQGGLGVGLVHHGVAGEQGRDGVGDAERERVVPRGDQRDHGPWAGAARPSGWRRGRCRRAARAPGGRARAGRSRACSPRRRGPPRRRACGPCRSPTGPGRGSRRGGRGWRRAAGGTGLIRSRTGSAAQACAPSRASAYAAWTSFAVETGRSARGSPVNGAVISWVLSLEATCRTMRSIMFGSRVRVAPRVTAMTAE